MLIYFFVLILGFLSLRGNLAFERVSRRKCWYDVTKPASDVDHFSSDIDIPYDREGRDLLGLMISDLAIQFSVNSRWGRYGFRTSRYSWIKRDEYVMWWNWTAPAGGDTRFPSGNAIDPFIYGGGPMSVEVMYSEPGDMMRDVDEQLRWRLERPDGSPSLSNWITATLQLSNPRRYHGSFEYSREKFYFDYKIVRQRNPRVSVDLGDTRLRLGLWPSQTLDEQNTRELEG
ncbi:MAG: hypothetical protein M1831_003704 [Alyxoria varia]|nr:MAG: hypothetical protein M1831_003704 [Alyxoria varia]